MRHLLIILTGVLSLTGCVSLEQHYHLNENGSGTVDLEMRSFSPELVERSLNTLGGDESELSNPETKWRQFRQVLANSNDLFGEETLVEWTALVPHEVGDRRETTVNWLRKNAPKVKLVFLESTIPKSANPLNGNQNGGVVTRFRFAFDDVSDMKAVSPTMFDLTWTEADGLVAFRHNVAPLVKWARKQRSTTSEDQGIFAMQADSVVGSQTFQTSFESPLHIIRSNAASQRSKVAKYEYELSELMSGRLRTHVLAIDLVREPP